MCVYFEEWTAPHHNYEDKCLKLAENWFVDLSLGAFLIGATEQ